MPPWVSAVAAVASFGFAVWSWWWSNKSSQARDKADDAKDTAEKARDTAVEQVATLTRVAETLEAQAANRDPWAVALRSKSQYRLTNISGADAVDVRLAGPARVSPAAFDRIENRSEAVFLAMLASGFKPTVVITWTPDRPGADEETVELVLPPRE